MLKDKRILLVIGGGIAAYKSLDLIRRLRERGATVRVILTKAGHEFVTPLSVSAIAGEQVFTDLFDPRSEFDVGHIRLARDTDMVVVAPATADLMAKMAGGHAGDLATTVLLATDKPILLAPAMNPRMWDNKATQRNAAQLGADGLRFVGPNEGEMAESGEGGIGRMAEPLEIVAAIEGLFAKPPATTRPLTGKHVLVTSGPTHEPIDPVRYIANRSSGKQGHAIAAAAVSAGANVTLISGPVHLPDPAGARMIKVETAREMLQAVEKSLPADVAIFAAAVADWGVAKPARAENQKRQIGRPAIRAHRKSRHPRHHRAAQCRTPGPRDRLCRRDRECDRARQRKTAPQGLRLDHRQRCVAANRDHGRRPQHGPSRHRQGRRILAAAIQDPGRAGA